VITSQQKPFFFVFLLFKPFSPGNRPFPRHAPNSVGLSNRIGPKSAGENGREPLSVPAMGGWILWLKKVNFIVFLFGDAPIGNGLSQSTNYRPQWSFLADGRQRSKMAEPARSKLKRHVGGTLKNEQPDV
jgi:hypothetical protein